jgi:cob(I)alamin adenosyltransferase
MSIYLYTGIGAGKTTNALGLALRSLGYEHRVVIIQFMKGRKDIGEFLFKEKAGKLGEKYEIFQYGREGFVNLEKPSGEDKEKAREGLQKVKEVLENPPELLILDEINLATAIGLLDTDEVVEILKKVPRKTDVVLTGRYAPYKLLISADFVNTIIPVKMPEDMDAKKGINY